MSSKLIADFPLDTDNERAPSMAIWPKRGVPGSATLNGLFALPSAASALAEDLGFRPTGICCICFRAMEEGSFRDVQYDVVDWLDRDIEKTTPTETTVDAHGFTWLTIHRPPDRFESLTADLHGACLKFAESGLGPQLLCALTVFRDRRGRQVALIYLYKRGTFYPFAPKTQESRDTHLELAFKNVIGGILRLEPDLGRWFPVWDAPGFRNDLIDIERHEEEITDLTRALGLNPEYAWALARRGVAYRLLNRYEDAIADLNHAINLEPQNSWALAERGQTYRSMGQNDEAMADFTKAIEADPGNSHAFGRRAMLYRALNRDENAIADFTRAVELDPQSALGWAGRASLYKLMGRHEEAAEDYTRAIGLNSSWATLYVGRGECYTTMRRWKDAIADLTRAVELDDNDAFVLAELGSSHLAIDRYEEAIRYLTRSIDLRPQDVWAIGKRAKAYLMSGRNEEALGDFTRVIDLQPENAWAFAGRGKTHSLMGQYDQALQDLWMATDLDAGRSDAFKQLKAVYQDHRRAKDAVAAGREVLGVKRREARSGQTADQEGLARWLTNFGVMLADLDQVADAREVSEEAMARWKELGVKRQGVAVAATNLAEIYVKLGQMDAARVAVNEAEAMCQELERAKPGSIKQDLMELLDDLHAQLSSSRDSS
jgi:tetratricopeptide (TPR) repeat protein